jgi:hypothetical protein
MTTPEFYRHSGRSGALGVPSATVAGLAAALVLGVVYTYAINWIPFIYVNFFATLGLGFAVGVAVGIGGQLGKIRNTKICAVIGFLCGLAALYIAWAFDPLARIGRDEGIIAWDITTIFSWMKIGYDEGFWSLGGAGAVSGIFVAIVWVIEAAMIVGLSTLMALVYAEDDPFCEDCNAWTEKEATVATLWPAEDDEKSLPALLEGDLTALTTLGRVQGSKYPRLELDLSTCPKCDASNYLTVKLCDKTVDKDGDISTNEEALLSNMVVAQEHLELIRNAGRDLPADAPKQESSTAQHLADLEDQAHAEDDDTDA